jgi:hypothetical protein
LKIEIEDVPFDNKLEHNTKAQQALERAAGVVHKLREIESPCGCEYYICEHWADLAMFVIAREEFYGTRNEPSRT